MPFPEDMQSIDEEGIEQTGRIGRTLEKLRSAERGHPRCSVPSTTVEMLVKIGGIGSWLTKLDTIGSVRPDFGARPVVS